MHVLEQVSNFKVSVIVPVYNTAGYLPECLNSLVGQTIGLDSIQIVVVDDGSTDGSDEVIRSYVERYPRNFVSLKQVNSGQGVARNLALDYCAGEFVGFMDSDDYADMNMYEAMYEEARSCGADMCICGIVGFCDLGKERLFDKRIQLPKAPTEMRDLFLTPQTQPPIRLVKRSVLEENDVRFSETHGSEDNGFHFKLAPYCRVVAVLGTPFVKRRYRATSTAANITPFFCEQFFAVTDDIIDYYERQGLLDYYGVLLEAALVRMLLCSRLGCVGLVEDACVRASLINKTKDYIDKYFSGRRRNPYLVGLLGIYLKHAGCLTMRLTCGFFADNYKRNTSLND